MKATSQLAILVLATFNLNAATLYVSLQSTNPVAPYATWETAATVIQDSVDAARDGDTVLVTNGVYAVGSREVSVLDMNQQPPQLVSIGLSRVVITNAIRLESVNGPFVTAIDGGVEVRCAYLGTDAVLKGLTLTNGFAANWGGGVYGGKIYDCILRGNEVPNGGRGDSAGGGAYSSSLYGCTLSDNWAGSGGGAYGSRLYGCRLSDNLAAIGGGAAESFLHNCVLVGNRAGVWLGDGFHGDTGGAVWGGRVYGCTLVGNIAAVGGGMFIPSEGDRGPLPSCNSIIVRNEGGDIAATEGSGYLGLNYCCSPLLTNGVGNIDADPRFVNAAAGDFRLRPDSPCIDAGTNLLSLIQTDITGEVRPWDGNKDGMAAFDIGAYEFRPSPVTLYVLVTSTNPVPPFTTWATAAKVIQDAVDVAKDGDTVLVGDGVYDVGGRETVIGPVFEGSSRVVVAGAVTVQSVNGPKLTAIDGTKTVRCAVLGPKSVMRGFTLTNGFATNGGGAYGGMLYDCWLIGNTTVPCGNHGRWPYAAGGGTYGGTLYNCIVAGNSACWGGGAYYSVLYNCVVSGNSAADDGGVGGVYDGALFNCIVYGNTNLNYVGSNLQYCCTSPLAADNPSNIDADPLFVDAANGDYRLRPESPCVDAGTNLLRSPIGVFSQVDAMWWDWVVVGTITDPTDILGNARGVDGNGDGKGGWDIGAYEFNSFPPPWFSSPPRLTSDGWKLNLTGAHNKWVHVQRSSNLKDWEEIWYDWMGSTGEKQVIDGDTGQRVMFYRAFVE